MMRWASEGTGEKIVDIVLGINEQSLAFYDEKIALASYSDVKCTLKTLDQLGQAIQQVDKEIANIQGHPGEYMRGMLKAFSCSVKLFQGDKIKYNDRLAAIQQLTAKPIPLANIQALSNKIEKALGDKGYKGSVTEKIKTFLAESVIAGENVTKVARELITEMRVQTLKKVTGLPQDEGISDISGITGVFWSGYSKYDGNNKGTLTFNTERPWSVPTFANILSHEAYPGHQTFYCLWDALYLEGKLPIEGSYYLINSPTNSLFEGAPENGLAFLGWLDDEDGSPEITSEEKESYRIGRDILDLQRMAQTGASYLYHVEGAEEKDALEYMAKSGVMTEIEAKNTVRFFTHPVQCTYYPSYYYGRHLVGQAFKLWGKKSPKDYFNSLYTLPHTNDTFITAVSEAIGTEFRPFDNI